MPCERRNRPNLNTLRNTLYIFLFFALFSCSNTQKSKTDATEFAEKVEEVMPFGEIEEEEEDPYDDSHIDDSRFSFEIPIGLEVATGSRFEVNYRTHLTDTISMHSLRHAYEVALIDSVELGKRWFCISFPKSNYYHKGDLILDVCKTVSYKEVDELFTYDGTLLEVLESRRTAFYNHPIESEQDLSPSYDIAFKGDFETADFTWYNVEDMTLNDSIRVSNII